MPLYNADALSAEMDPPSVQIGGVVYLGRHLSVLELSRTMQLLVPLQKLNPITQADEFAALARQVIDEVFPPATETRTRRTWWGATRVEHVPVRPTVADRVLALDLRTAVRLITNFCHSLLAALGSDTSSANGGDSSDTLELPQREGRT